MEEKINIAEILKDKPNGIRLYSPMFGECSFSFVQEETDDICVNQHNGEKAFFNSKGLYNILGECLLFPSKGMRDWSKFAWKKGDVLVSDDGCIEVIFDRWYDDTYTSFYCKHYLDSEDENDITYLKESICLTRKYSLDDTESFLCYVNTIEEKLGGKLNLETLKIEKQYEFKDGDVVFVRCKRFCYIEIFNYFKDDYLYDYASLSTTLHIIDICGEYPIAKDEIIEIRIATDSEKKQLFEALAKKNKVWDSEKKQIVDLKPKWMDLKPFDKVITRVHNNAIWTANIFSHIDQHGKYVTIGCISGYTYCLPYNDDTAHLI